MRDTKSPDRIYLQPECCVTSDGRMWCEDDAPVDCPDGEPWVEYVRADLVHVGSGDPMDCPGGHGEACCGHISLCEEALERGRP